MIENKTYYPTPEKIIMKYKKPECCQKISEDKWNAPLGYCWAFALVTIIT